MHELWIPVLGIIAFFSTVISVFYFHYRAKGHKLDTIVKLAQSDGEVKPEMIAALGQEGGPTGDMRKGLIWLAIGVPLVIAMLVGEDLEAAAYGLVPVMIGVAYLVVMKFGHPDKGPQSGA